MITVEYDVFSGMPNPTWQLDADQVDEFFRLLPLNLPFVTSVVLAEGTLGYRGLIVRATGLDATRMLLLGLPSSIRVFGDILSGISDLVSMLATIPAEVIANLLPAIDGSEVAYEEGSGNEVPEEGGATLAATSACSLAYTSWNNFTFWNGSRKTKNNCYNYAANYASNTDLPGTASDGRALPGRITGHPMPGGATDAQFRSAMQSDGWRLTCDGTSLKVYAVTGAVLGPGGLWYWDFHFYRRNLNSAGTNRWCHKPGHTAATNKDASGEYITNPQSADRSGPGFDYYHEVDFFFSAPGVRAVKVK